MPYSLKGTLGKLETVQPLSPIWMLERVSQIDWMNVNDVDIDNSVDIILRITADLIILIHSKDEKNYENYIAEFQNIRKNIEYSGIVKKSAELKIYYDKYCKYLEKAI